METGETRSVAATVVRVSQSYWPILILFGTYLAYLLAAGRFSWSVYDAGLGLLGAQNIIEGQIPFRDFYTVYPPGSLYFTAALFKVFGSSIFVTRVAGAIITFLTVLCAFLIAKDITDRRYAVLSSILVIGALVVSGSGLTQALLLALVACIYLFRLHTYNGTRDVLVLGLITAITGFFRLDTGLYLFIALSLTLLLYNFLGTMSASRPKRRLRGAMKVWGIYVSGILVVAVPVLIFFLHAVPLRDLVDQLIVYPRSIFPAYRSLPPPSPLRGDIVFRVFFYFPILVYLATAVWLSAQVIQKKTKLSEQPKPLFLLLFGALLFLYASVRVDTGHLVPTLVISMILFVWLGVSVIKQRRQSMEPNAVHAIRPVVSLSYLFIILYIVLLLFLYGRYRLATGLLVPTLVISMILFVWLGVSVIKQRRQSMEPNAVHAIRPVVSLSYLFIILYIVLLLLNSTVSMLNPTQPGMVALDIPRAQGAYLNAKEARNLTDATAFIRTHVPENQTIFVGNAQHQQILENNVIFYFLSERASATKYYELHPGVATTAVVQNQIINDITRHDTKYIVLWSGRAATLKEPNQSRYASGVGNLDTFIHENFVPIERYGDYTIYARADIADSAASAQ